MQRCKIARSDPLSRTVRRWRIGFFSPGGVDHQPSSSNKMESRRSAGWKQCGVVAEHLCHFHIVDLALAREKWPS